jgi:hemoglobin
MPPSLFERSGGFATVSRIVSAFYDKVLDSPRLSPYFAGTDMRRLIDHQSKFIAQVMGGPVSYTNDALERTHAHLGIDQQSFDEVVGLLTETLLDFEVPAADVAMVERQLRDRARYIVARA